MATPTTAKADTTLGFSRFSFPQNRSMTRSILLGSDYPQDREIEVQDLERMSQVNALELLGKFPFEICSSLVSIMGTDLEAETTYNSDKDDVESYFAYCAMMLDKVIFLLNPSAFPVRNKLPADLLLKLGEFVVLLNHLIGTFDLNVAPFFEVPSKEELVGDFNRTGSKDFDLIFPYELIRAIGVYYSTYARLGESEAAKIAKLEGDDRAIFTALFERICNGSGEFQYGVVVGASTAHRYHAALAFGGESGVSVIVKFDSADVSVIRLSILKSLVVLETEIKQICSVIVGAWHYFVTEPRQLQRHGSLRLESWWMSMLECSELAGQLFRFSALVGRLSVIGIELSSDKFMKLGKETMNAYKNFVISNGEKFPKRMDKILSIAEQEAALLYDVMVCKNVVSSRRSGPLQFAQTAKDRKERMQAFYIQNQQQFLKISLEHIRWLGMDYSKMDREVPKDFLAQVAGDYGFHDIQKRFIGHWLAKHRRKGR